MSTCAICTCKTAVNLMEAEMGGIRAFKYNGKLLCQDCYLEVLAGHQSGIAVARS
jgi:hypothetical protein